MEEQNILATLVDLTKQRDQLSLKAKLLGTLVHITDAAWIILCRLIAEEGQDRIKVLDRLPNDRFGRAWQLYPEQLVADVEPFLRCRRDGHPIWLQGMHPYQAIVFALPDNGRHDDFVVVCNDRIEGRLERIVACVLDLYGNFFKLLVENTQDSLTRLFNRQSFDQDLLRYLSAIQTERRHDESPRRCFLAMFDIDRFKRVNDTYGHLYGDEVLLLFASLMRKNFREDDHLYRYGGEEFAALLCGLDEGGVQASLERFRALVEAYDFPQVGQVTVSIGFAELKGHVMPSTAVEYADAALYYAKEHGRNQVYQYERLVLDNKLSRNGRNEGSVELF